MNVLTCLRTIKYSPINEIINCLNELPNNYSFDVPSFISVMEKCFGDDIVKCQIHLNNGKIVQFAGIIVILADITNLPNLILRKKLLLKMILICDFYKIDYKDVNYFLKIANEFERLFDKVS